MDSECLVSFEKVCHINGCAIIPKVIMDWNPSPLLDRSLKCLITKKGGSFSATKTLRTSIKQGSILPFGVVAHACSLCRTTFLEAAVYEVQNAD